MTPVKTAIVGNGNVAWSLVPALLASPLVDLRWHVVRHLPEASSSSLKFLQSVEEIPADAELILIAVPDDAVAEVIGSFGQRQAVIAHTSGTVPLPAGAEGESYGVFYPLQTFTKGRPVLLKDVPFLIEGSNEKVEGLLIQVARSLGGNPVKADSAKRKRIHLAAVFACNFANHLWGKASEILSGEGADLTLLGPLLHETIDKALTIGPAAAQTGPARRGDVATQTEHLAMLSPNDREIYTLLTRSIAQRYEQNSI